MPPRKRVAKRYCKKRILKPNTVVYPRGSQNPPKSSSEASYG